MPNGEKLLVRAVRVGVYGCADDPCPHVDKFGKKNICLTRRYPKHYPAPSNPKPGHGEPFWIKAEHLSDCRKNRPHGGPGWMEIMDPQPVAAPAPLVAVAVEPEAPKAKKSRRVV